MIKATAFDKTIAATYEKTRPINRIECQKAFSSALSTVRKKPRTRILEVGCGTGRILECLVPDFVFPTQVVGLDKSAAMLRFAKQKPSLEGAELKHTSLFDYEASLRGAEQFDVVICHWLFHCIEPWQAAVLASLRLVKREGVLTWLEEDGDLYRALDHIAPGAQDEGAQLVYELFDAYYREVAKRRGRTQADLPDPELRAGTILRNTGILKKFLPNCGWIVVDGQEQVQWFSDFKLSDIFEKFLAPRVFTNLQSIPLGIHRAAIRKVEKDLRKKLAQPIRLRFWAQGYYARQNERDIGPIQAAKHITRVAEEMRPYVLALSESNSKGGPVGQITKSLLEQFFISLFDRSPSALWSSFWWPREQNGAQQPNLPLWVWIRLSTHRRESFRKYLHGALYKLGHEVLNEEIVRLYLSRRNPFLSLIRQGPVEFEPVALDIVNDSIGHSWGVIPKSVCDESKKAVFIQVPRSFFEAYCPRPSEFKPFTQEEWKAAVADHRDEILHKGPLDPDRSQIRQALIGVGNRLDHEITINRFRGEGGLASLLDLFQNIALFQGSAYYLFPVPRVGGEVGGSITLGCNQSLSHLQLCTLQSIAEALLLLPAVIASAETVE